MEKQETNIKIGRLLTPGSIIFSDSTTGKIEVIKKLVGCIAGLNPVFDSGLALEKVLAREEGMSTVLDTGLCIPHARLDGIPDFLAALAIFPGGLSDSSGSGITIKAIFLFLSPNNPAFFKSHLKLLTALSSLFQPAFIERLISFKTPQEVINAINTFK